MSRILVVEDDEVLRNELIELLRNEGYEAEYISTFSDTAGQIIKSKPDLVLLDINIPELNGELVVSFRIYYNKGNQRTLKNP